jgi:ribosomal protein S18 acetylase RimI-like enzyme
MNTVPKQNIMITPVKNDDYSLHSLLQLFLENPARYLATPKTINELKNNLLSGTEYYFITNEQANIFGAIGFRPQTSMICNLIVDYSYRHYHYGPTAMCKLEECIRSKGVLKVFAEVIKKNECACKVFAKMGYEVINEGYDVPHHLFCKKLREE